MPLSKDLISQFVKSTKDNNKKKNTETFVTGEIVKKENGQYWAKIYGSNSVTPVTIPNNVSRGKPVNIMIKNHTAHVIGNVSTDADNGFGDSDDVFSDTSSSCVRIGEEYIDALWSDYFLPTTEQVTYIKEAMESSDPEETNSEGLYLLDIYVTLGDDLNVKDVTNVAIYDDDELVAYCTDYHNNDGDLFGTAYVPKGGYTYTIIIKYTKNV